MNDRLLTLVFSGSGFGKSTDHVLSFPMCLFIGAEGFDLFAANAFGYKPPQINTARTYMDVVTILQKFGKDPRFDGFVIDDASILGKDTEGWLRTNDRDARGQNAYNIFVSRTLELIHCIEDLGRPIFVNGHERTSRTNNAGKFLRGGVDLPCDMTETWTARVHAAFRATRIDETGQDVVPTPIHAHPLKYWSKAADPDWAVRNRVGVPASVPMNLGEIVRTLGRFTFRKPPGMEWMESAVDRTTELIQSADSDRRSALQEAIKKMTEKNRPTKQILWVLRDAEDRVTLRKLMEKEELARYTDG